MTKVGEIGCVGLVSGVLVLGLSFLAQHSNTQADERTKCQEALKLGLEESTPGPGWEVVLLTPGQKVGQRLCADPQIDRIKKQVVCLSDVAGVGDIRNEQPTRLVMESDSPDGPEVAVLLNWSVR